MKSFLAKCLGDRFHHFKINIETLPKRKSCWWMTFKITWEMKNAPLTKLFLAQYLDDRSCPFQWTSWDLGTLKGWWMTSIVETKNAHINSIVRIFWWLPWSWWPLSFQVKDALAIVEIHTAGFYTPEVQFKANFWGRWICKQLVITFRGSGWEFFAMQKIMSWESINCQDDHKIKISLVKMQKDVQAETEIVQFESLALLHFHRSCPAQIKVPWAIINVLLGGRWTSNLAEHDLAFRICGAWIQ